MTHLPEYRIEWHRGLQRIDELRERWIALEEAVEGRTVYSTWDFVVPWYRCYAGTKHTDFGEPLVGLLWRGGELQAVAPLITSRSSFRGWRLRRVTVAGYNLAAGELLIREGASGIRERLTEALIEDLGFDRVLTNGAPESSSEHLELSSFAASRGLRAGVTPFDSYAIADLSRGYEHYARSKSANFRRQTKRIARTANLGATTRLERLAERAEASEAARWVSRVFSITERGWRALEAGVAEEREHQPLVRDVILEFARKGRLDLSILVIDGVDAATTLGLVDRGVYFHFLVAHDESLSRFAPGSHLLQEVFKLLPERGVHTVISHGGYSYKERWATRIVPQSRLCIAGRGLRAIAAHVLKFRLVEPLRGPKPGKAQEAPPHP